MTGETAGIVGIGRIGSAFARRCTALGMRVIAYDPCVTQSDVDAVTGAELVPDLDTLLAGSDYVSLHCPLNDETWHLISAAQLRRMRPHAVLIHTARGAIIEQARANLTEAVSLFFEAASPAGVRTGLRG